MNGPAAQWKITAQYFQRNASSWTQPASTGGSRLSSPGIFALVQGSSVAGSSYTCSTGVADLHPFLHTPKTGMMPAL